MKSNARPRSARLPEMTITLTELAKEIEQADYTLRREAAETVEFIRTSDSDELSSLRLCHRLLAVIRAVYDKKKGSLPNSGWRFIAASLIVKTMCSVRAAYTLGTAGHATEVPIIVRSALESLITATFIMKEDSARRAKRWVQYGVVMRAKVLKKNRKYPELAAPERKADRKKILAQARRFKRYFPRQAFWASGLNRGSLADLAEDVDMTYHYDFVYWLGSQATHASAIAVQQLVAGSSPGVATYQMALSIDGLRGQLAVCCELLIRCLAALNALSELQLSDFDVELLREYKVAMGEEPAHDR